MSEESITISFEISGGLDLNRLAAWVAQRADEWGCEAPAVHCAGGLGRIHLDFCMIDTAVMERVISELQAHGAREVVVTAMYDGAGSMLVYAMFAGRLLSFSSLSELNEYKREQGKPVGPMKFDYGKERSNRTALVRLKIASERAMRRIAALFRSALANGGEEDLGSFYHDFAALNKSDSRDLRWCALRIKGRDEWYEGPEELIKGLKFVVEEEGHLYLGFDLERTGLSFGLAGRSWDEELEHLVYVFELLDGVQKVWVKVRPGANTVKELYTYFPGMGDTATVLRRPLTEDSEWPRANG